MSRFERELLFGICLVGMSSCGLSAQILSTNEIDGGSNDTDSDSGTDTDTDTDTDADTDACTHGEVNANEVLLAGDSWIRLPGTQLLDIARTAGAIGQNEAYVILAADGADITATRNQYNTQEAGVTKVKVLIMDGGGMDLIQSGGSLESSTAVVDAFTQHLAQVEADGTVEHIIYSLYPEGTITPGVATVRPGMQAACAASVVPCHFLDLQPKWEGHPEYTTADTINPSTVGAEVIAEAIWNIMQQNCIAQ